MKKIVFVCLGNICRSPAAEGVFLHILKQQGIAEQFVVDSAGTSGHHDGEAADPRMIKTARKRGIELPSISRKFIAADFEKFDLIIAMDDSNVRNILRLDTSDLYREKVVKLTDFRSKILEFDEVPDPYYGGDAGFELVLDLVDDGCNGLLEQLS